MVLVVEASVLLDLSNLRIAGLFDHHDVLGVRASHPWLLLQDLRPVGLEVVDR